MIKLIRHKIMKMDLPPEILMTIFIYLNRQDIYNTQLVNKLFNNVINSNYFCYKVLNKITYCDYSYESEINYNRYIKDFYTYRYKDLNTMYVTDECINKYIVTYWWRKGQIYLCSCVTHLSQRTFIFSCALGLKHIVEDLKDKIDVEDSFYEKEQGNIKIFTVINLMIKREQLDILKILLQGGRKYFIDSYVTQALDKPHILKLILEEYKYTIPGVKNEHKYLVYCIETNNIESIKHILDYGVNYNIINIEGEFWRNYQEINSILNDKGIKLNIIYEEYPAVPIILSICMMVSLIILCG